MPLTIVKKSPPARRPIKKGDLVQNGDSSKLLVAVTDQKSNRFDAVMLIGTTKFDNINPGDVGRGWDVSYYTHVDGPITLQNS